MGKATLIPAVLMRKKDVAELIPCSKRKVELMVKAGNLPKPFYISDSSPRWWRSNIDSWLEKFVTEAQSEAVSE